MLLLLTQCSSKSSVDKKNTFYISFSSEPATLNPINSSDIYAANVHKYVIDTLLTRDPNTNEYKPGLAESWDVSEDGKTYSFNLRKGVRFSDGKELKANDVKFSFDAVLNPKYEAAHKLSYFENINSPQIVDDHTISFTTKNKYFGDIDTLARGINIVPEVVYSKQSRENQLSKTLIGSGPYKIQKYKRSKSIILVKNKYWWGYKADQDNLRNIHRFNKIHIRFIKEDSIRLELLKKGELSFSEVKGEEFVNKIDNSKPEWSHLEKHEVENDAYKGYSFIAWNLKNSLFKDKKVRIALAHLMDRELLREKFQYGKSYLAAGPVYPQSMYADKSVKPIQFNPIKGKSMLNDAGWKDSDKDGILDKKINGKQVDFIFSLLNPNRDSEKYFTVYKESLKNAGIEVNIKNVDWNSFVKALNERKFDAVTLNWNHSEEDIDIDFKQVWHSDSSKGTGSNFISYSNSTVDKLIDQSRAELRREKRIPIMQKVYKEIAEDAPYLFMFVPKMLYVVSNNIEVSQITYKYSIGVPYWTSKVSE